MNLLIQLKITLEASATLISIVWRPPVVGVLENSTVYNHKWFFKDTKLSITLSAPITGRCSYDQLFLFLN